MEGRDDEGLSFHEIISSDMYANLDIRQSYAQNFTTSQTRFWQNLIPFSTKLSNIFTICWTRDLHSLHTPSCKIRGHCEHREWQFIREWLFHCNANRGAAGDFSHFVLPCLGCGTYGRSCRKDYSQWIEVIQTRARGTDG